MANYGRRQQPAITISSMQPWIQYQADSCRCNDVAVNAPYRWRRWLAQGAILEAAKTTSSQIIILTLIYDIFNTKTSYYIEYCATCSVGCRHDFSLDDLQLETTKQKQCASLAVCTKWLLLLDWPQQPIEYRSTAYVVRHQTSHIYMNIYIELWKYVFLRLFLKLINATQAANHCVTRVSINVCDSMDVWKSISILGVDGMDPACTLIGSA